MNDERPIMRFTFSPLALTVFFAAAAWPFVMNAISSALLSPLERAIRSSWCGLPIHDHAVLFGHCAACWAGSALLVFIGLILSLSPHEPRRALIR